MLPLIGGLISGGASLLGSVFSSETSAQNTQAQLAAQQQMQAQSEAFNEEERARSADVNQQFMSEAQSFDTGMVNQQEAFQQQMSNTAYQRASQDMQKAGLNPMMMFGSGGAASTPSGGAISSPSASSPSASIGTPSVPMSQRTSPLAGLGDAVGKAISSASALKQMAATDADIALRNSQKGATDASALQTQAQTITEGKRQGLLDAETAGQRFDNTVKQMHATAAKNVNEAGDSYPTVRKALDVGGYVAGKVGDVGRAIGSFIPSASSLYRLYVPRRSTSETASDPSTGDTFTERFHY